MLRLGGWLIDARTNWRRWRLGISVEVHPFIRLMDVWVGPVSVNGTYMDPRFLRRAGERIMERLRQEAEQL